MMAGWKAARGAAKRQHRPEFEVDGPAPPVTPGHFHDILIGTDLPKLICINAFRLQRKRASGPHDLTSMIAAFAAARGHQ
jgi:hypothetical protein